MRVSTLNTLSPGDVELGVVYASVEGVNEKSYDECIEQLTHKAQALGATTLVARSWCRASSSGTSGRACSPRR